MFIRVPPEPRADSGLAAALARLCRGSPWLSYPQQQQLMEILPSFLLHVWMNSGDFKTETCLELSVQMKN